jgi:hypothetical protein
MDGGLDAPGPRVAEILPEALDPHGSAVGMWPGSGDPGCGVHGTHDGKPSIRLELARRRRHRRRASPPTDRAECTVHATSRLREELVSARRRSTARGSSPCRRRPGP